MKTLAELNAMVTAKERLRCEFVVETSIDTDGGTHFYDLSDAFVYLSSVLREQTDVELFDREDFEEIDYIILTIHFIDDNKVKPLVKLIRKDDIEFIEIP
jgi:hypothetical protein